MPNDTEILLDDVETILDKDLKKQARDGLAIVYTEFGCKGVADDIKKGHKVTENAEFGFRLCVHDKVSPRVNPETLEFHPQTSRGAELEERVEEGINKLLELGGYEKMSSDLIPKLREKDKTFEKKIKKRRK